MSTDKNLNNSLLTPPSRTGQFCFKLVACEIYYRELCLVAAQSPNIIDLVFLSKGLHDIGSDKMRARLQENIDQTPPDKYDAILLAYGRCNNGTVGLLTGNNQVVIPRLHDCIGVLLGSVARYQEWFNNHPGTFYRSSGWIERDFIPSDSVMCQLGLNLSHNELIEKYGADNAGFIIEQLGNWTDTYSDLAYIDMGLTVDQEYIELTKKEAQEKKLTFHRLDGDMTLLRNLVNGNWPESDFLIAEPGSIIQSNDNGLIIDSKKL